MANPRRVSYSNSNQLPISDPINPFQSQTPQTAATLFNSLKFFLKKPHAVPFLLSFFLFLTWVALRFQHYSSDSSFHQLAYDSNRVTLHGGYDKYSDANIVKFPLSSSIVMKDKRGWLINPVSLALDAAISGGASFCVSVHLGEIRPGGMRGNHRHHTCNETFVIWGAKTLFRLENKAVAKGYAQVTIGSDEVAVAASSSGTAHALVNADPVRSTFFMGCQDSIINYRAELHGGQCRHWPHMGLLAAVEEAALELPTVEEASPETRMEEEADAQRHRLVQEWVPFPWHTLTRDGSLKMDDIKYAVCGPCSICCQRFLLVLFCLLGLLAVQGRC